MNENDSAFYSLFFILNESKGINLENLFKLKNGIWYVFYFQHSGKKTCISTKSKLKSDALNYSNKIFPIK